MLLLASLFLMISAVVLAAGLSSRMGQLKQVMLWNSKPIVRHIVDTLIASGIDDVVVVTGYAREKVEETLKGCKVRSVFNPDYANGEMMRSFQVGLITAYQDSSGALFVLGDQPQMQEATVRAVIAHWQMSQARIVAPSFKRRRGHPIFFARDVWTDILSVSQGISPRDFLQTHADWIDYIQVGTDSILRDVDILDDYWRDRPTE